MKNLCVITARGGSTRILKKNIVNVGGLPLVAWSIKAAVDSGLFDKVLVSTDCEEIAQVSREHGAEVPFLRTDASGSSATASEAAVVALEQSEEYWGYKFDNVVLLMPTCPLRSAGVIKKQFAYFEAQKCNFVLSCAEYGPCKPWWAATLNEHGQPKYLNPEAMKKRSQDLETAVAPSGAIWIANRDALLKEKNYYGEGHQFYTIPWVAAIDIDYAEDIDLIEVILGNKNWKILEN